MAEEPFMVGSMEQSERLVEIGSCAVQTRQTGPSEPTDRLSHGLTYKSGNSGGEEGSHLQLVCPK